MATASSPELVIIAALTASRRVIGNQGTLPWHLPDDLKRFRQLTIGHPIIVGRKTWEIGLNRRSLPQRHTIVVSRSLAPQPSQHHNDSHTTCCIVPSLQEAIAQVQQARRAFIIGGASIYEQTLAIAHRLELTLIKHEINGDAFFPPYQDYVKQQCQLLQRSDEGEFWLETYQCRPEADFREMVRRVEPPDLERNSKRG